MISCATTDCCNINILHCGNMLLSCGSRLQIPAILDYFILYSVYISCRFLSLCYKNTIGARSCGASKWMILKGTLTSYPCSQYAWNLRSKLWKLKNKRGQLPNALGQLNNKRGQLPNAWGQLKNKQGQLPNAWGQLNNTRGQLPNAWGQLNNKRGQLPYAWGELNNTQD